MNADNRGSEVRGQRSEIRNLLRVLCVSAVIAILGCASNPQVGFQPAGQDNEFKVAEEMRIGDKGRDIDKSATTTTNIRGEIVKVSPMPGLLTISASVTLALMFGFAVFVTDRMLAYRHGLGVVQEAIAEKGHAQFVAEIKPRIKAMGRRRKRLFDHLLEKNGCLIRNGSTAPTTRS